METVIHTISFSIINKVRIPMDHMGQITSIFRETSPSMTEMVLKSTTTIGQCKITNPPMQILIVTDKTTRETRKCRPRGPEADRCKEAHDGYLKLFEIVILWIFYTIPFGFSLFRHFWVIIFQLFKFHCLAKDH